MLSAILQSLTGDHVSTLKKIFFYQLKLSKMMIHIYTLYKDEFSISINFSTYIYLHDFLITYQYLFPI